MSFKRLIKYVAITRTQIVNSVAYPIDLATRSLMIVLFMFIFAHLWEVTYRAMGQSVLAGLSLSATMWYFMVAETIVLSKPRLSNTIAEQVRDGSVSYLLSKPYNFLLYHFSVAFGDAIVRMAFNVLAGGITVWLMVGPPPALTGIPFVLIAISLGWLIDSAMTALIGLAAFAVEDVAAYDWIYSKLVLILGGTLIPLDFFPDWLRGIAQASPFAYATYGPARLFVSPDPTSFVLLALGQVFWIGALSVLLSLGYRKALAQLTINGG